MPDEQKDVTEKVLAGMKDSRKTGRCETCGYDGQDNELFNCESCGKPICTDCYSMTDDFEMICQDCVRARGLTSDDLQV
jgi:hypothetical protein